MLKARPLLRIRYGSEDDAGAGAPSRRRPTARGRAVSITNALRTRVSPANLSGAIDSAATNSRSQWLIFAAAFMISACTTGIMSAM